MATRKDVEQKAARQSLVIRTCQQEDGRTLYRFYRRSAAIAPDTCLNESIGARQSLRWLKARADRIAADTAHVAKLADVARERKMIKAVRVVAGNVTARADYRFSRFR